MLRCLFSAPVDFDEEVWKEYQATFDMWHEYLDLLDQIPRECPDPENVVAWVCNPSADFIIGNQQLKKYPNLKIIATPSTGNNHIDLEVVKWRGLKFISLLDDREGLETISASAEFTFKLLLDALRMRPARELQNKRIGLVGYGRIGWKLCQWCTAFGAYVDIYDPYQKKHATYHTDLKSMFAKCDAVIICCSLTPETRGMIGYDLLSGMKPGAALVNTARGEIIDEEALVRIMDERHRNPSWDGRNQLRVALDVVCGEVTGTANRERLRALGAIVTPHIAGETFESRTKAARIILGLLKRELETLKAVA